MHAAKRNATEQTLLIDERGARETDVRSHHANLRSLIRLAGSGFLIGQSYIDP